MIFLSEADIDAMREVAERLRTDDGDVGYGYFHGGDPRDFCPDPECCTEKEIAAHKRACELMDSGAVKFVDGRHHFPLPDGREGWMTCPAFGIGTYTIKDAELSTLANELDALVDRIRAAEDMRK